MVEGSVLRLFTFRAVRPAFDEILRHDLVPDLSAQPGILDCYSGRQGPEEIGPRIVSTVWRDHASMIAAVGQELGQGPFHPELLEETTDRVLEVLPIRVAATAELVEHRAPKILRTLRGRVGHIGLGDYLADVEVGTFADITAGIGPTALYVAEMAPDRFITLSAWRDWPDIERATGGNVHQPRTTRHLEHLVEWDVAHYEIVQSSWDPASETARSPGGDPARA